MHETYKQHAHRCLPMLMANQSGWLILNTHPFHVTWDGGVGTGALSIDYEGSPPSRPLAASIFGYGILTWNVPYLFRTPAGFNLLARGPANLPKDGISALEGLVETDWAIANFTMNWKLTRAHQPVQFAAGEPFCMVVPQQRHALEQFTPSQLPLEQNPELREQWDTFHRQRALMAGVRQIALQRGDQSLLDRIPFERHYFNGTSPGGHSANEHQTKLTLGKFTTQARDSSIE